jgi:hypothetical protein
MRQQPECWGPKVVKVKLPKQSAKAPIGRDIRETLRVPNVPVGLVTGMHTFNRMEPRAYHDLYNTTFRVTTDATITTTGTQVPGPGGLTSEQIQYLMREQRNHMEAIEPEYDPNDEPPEDRDTNA